MSNLLNFTVFDTETTGLDPKKGDRIIEIAGLKVVNGEIQEECNFVELVNPERKIPWEAQRINKIEDAHVANARTIDAVLPEFLQFAEGTTLIAHNARFDMGFLEQEKQLCWGFVDLPECLCTMQLSRTLYPQEFRHNLNVIAARFGLEMPVDRHRALPDVVLTAQALLRMMEEHNIVDLEHLRKVASVKSLATNR